MASTPHEAMFHERLKEHVFKRREVNPEVYPNGLLEDKKAIVYSIGSKGSLSATERALLNIFPNTRYAKSFPESKAILASNADAIVRIDNKEGRFIGGVMIKPFGSEVEVHYGKIVYPGLEDIEGPKSAVLAAVKLKRLPNNYKSRFKEIRKELPDNVATSFFADPGSEAIHLVAIAEADHAEAPRIARLAEELAKKLSEEEQQG